MRLSITCALTGAAILTGGCGHKAAADPTFSVCSTNTVVSAAQRREADWPDGTLGVLHNSNGSYTFVGADGPKTVVTTVGTLSSPAVYGYGGTQVQDLQQPYDYVAGGPVYKDPQTGTWLLFYHAERWPSGDATKFYATIGMAISNDQGQTWEDLGEIIRPNIPYSDSATSPVEVGGGEYTVRGGYLYVYFRNTTSSYTQMLSVARAKITDVLTASRAGTVTPWHNFYNGAWTQPSLGGLSSTLESGNPITRWFDVGYSPTLKQYVMVIAGYPEAPPISRSEVNLFVTTSPNGLAWGPRQQLTNDGVEDMYPTVVGLSGNPKTLGTKFYVYYTSSQVGGYQRWDDANLDRRTISSGSC